MSSNSDRGAADAHLLHTHRHAQPQPHRRRAPTRINKKLAPAADGPTLALCEASRARVSPVVAMSDWTIGESDPGATGDDRIPMAMQKRTLTTSALSAVWRGRLPLRDLLRSRPSSTTERAPSSSVG
jgi:hypothetical protein